MKKISLYIWISSEILWWCVGIRSHVLLPKPQERTKACLHTYQDILFYVLNGGDFLWNSIWSDYICFFQSELWYNNIIFLVLIWQKFCMFMLCMDSMEYLIFVYTHCHCWMTLVYFILHQFSSWDHWGSRWGFCFQTWNTNAALEFLCRRARYNLQ